MTSRNFLTKTNRTKARHGSTHTPILEKLDEKKAISKHTERESATQEEASQMHPLPAKINSRAMKFTAIPYKLFHVQKYPTDWVKVKGPALRAHMFCAHVIT